MKQQKRRTYEERSVLVYMKKSESLKEAEQRLAREWKNGEHPLQVERAKRERS